MWEGRHRSAGRTLRHGEEAAQSTGHLDVKVEHFPEVAETMAKG